MQALMPQINQARQALGMLKSASNPQAMLQQMIQRSPQAQQIQMVLSSANGNYDAWIASECQKRGINPQEFMNALTQGL